MVIIMEDKKVLVITEDFGSTDESSVVEVFLVNKNIILRDLWKEYKKTNRIQIKSFLRWLIEDKKLTRIEFEEEKL